MLEYKGIVIYTHRNVYEPAEDTFLLAENLDIQRRDEVLEIGAGTGLITVVAAQKSKKVTATDINEDAVKCALKNTITNRTYNVELKTGNLFEPVEDEKFDLILFNTPYLPTDEDEKFDEEINAAWDGGADGRATIDKFLNEVKDHLNEGGRVQLVQSSLSNNEKTIQKLEELGFEAGITASEKCFFEEIVVITGILK
ncbi:MULTISPECIES: HemK2/MTQ2 family protein methyltransferase [Methanobacterium]|uniref:Methyltransferase n=1 Tax=Methanobacterium bryantii TaxID=2161 RepID=A0A2A2H649_METBR|nr:MULTISPECIES: HemK2/MTQ2 family protein methyltransferase [Methanobacterium]OEC85936.1 methyltransferase [Methanobacterium sp. A39]PAV04909.1 methyltransferase [Methanobacterium bryantii]